MNRINFVTLFLITLLSVEIIAQEETDLKNLQNYTPAILISKNQTDFKLHNSLYTQLSFFDEKRNKIDANERSTFFTSMADYYYGLSSRVSLGGELWFKSAFVGSTNSSATNVLSFTNSSKSRTGINLAGLKVKFNPLKKWKRFSVQTGILLSVISDPQSEKLNRPFLDDNRHLWITNFLYDKKVTEKLQLFTQLSARVSIDKDLANENTNIATPFDLFISYFPTKKITFYIQNQLQPTIGNEGIISYFLQEGLGLKYQIFKGVEIGTAYSINLIGDNTGAGETFNLAVRILH